MLLRTKPFERNGYRKAGNIVCKIFITFNINKINYQFYLYPYLSIKKQIYYNNINIIDDK